MKSARARRLTFELLEPKVAPSAMLLAVAPLDEADQRLIEQDVMYAPVHAGESTNHQAHVALLEYIQRNTVGDAEAKSSLAWPSQAEAEAADKMMTATDAELRTMLVTELLQAQPTDGGHVISVIQY